MTHSDKIEVEVISKIKFGKSFESSEFLTLVLPLVNNAIQCLLVFLMNMFDSTNFLFLMIHFTALVGPFNWLGRSAFGSMNSEERAGGFYCCLSLPASSSVLTRGP